MTSLLLFSTTSLTFCTKVDHCDDFSHKRGFHLVALWDFKIGGNQCRHNLSLSQWASSPLAIGSVNNLTWCCSCWCSMHITMWVHTSFYTLWKRIESFNEYYLIFYWKLLLLLSEVNNATILLMVLLNSIDGKNRWSSYTATLLSLLLAIDRAYMACHYGLEPLVWSCVTGLWWHLWKTKPLDGTVTLLANNSLASAYAAPHKRWYVVVVLCNQQF